MVIPCLSRHLDGDEQTEHRSQNGCRKFLHLGIIPQHTDDACHSHTYPDSKGVERTGIRIVSFTGLRRSLVEVEYDSDTCHKEQEEYHPELLDASLAMVSLPEESDQTENQRQTVEYIMTFIVFEILRKQFLVTYQQVVDKRNTGDPVAVLDFSATLYVILPSGKVPHEVTPVHEV